MKPSSDKPSDDKSESSRSGSLWLRGLLLLGLIAAAVLVYVFFGDQLSLEAFAQREGQLRQLQSDQPLLVYSAAFGIYVLVTGLSIPGATGLTLLYGWYFGFWQGVVLVSFASTSGATVAFLLSRYLFRDAIQDRFGERLQAFNRELDKEGAFYLLSLRLIPAIPFFVINVVMGLTPIRTRTYWWVSQLGMLPATFVYVYAGSVVPSLDVLADEGIGAVLTATQITQMIVAFALLGLLPLVMRKLLQWFAPGVASDQTDSTDKTDSVDDVASQPSEKKAE